MQRGMENCAASFVSMQRERGGGVCAKIFSMPIKGGGGGEKVAEFCSGRSLLYYIKCDKCANL